jgi:hypothetical protein
MPQIGTDIVASFDVRLAPQSDFSQENSGKTAWGILAEARRVCSGLYPCGLQRLS